MFQIACLFGEKPFWGFQLALSLGIQKNHPTFSSLLFLPANFLYCLRLKTCDDDALEDMANRCNEQAHRWFCGLSNIQWNLVGLIDVTKSDDKKAQKFLKLGIRPMHRIPFNSHPIRSRWTAASWFAHRPKQLPMSSTRRAPDTWVGGLAFGFDLNPWIKSNFEIWVCQRPRKVSSCREQPKSKLHRTIFSWNKPSRSPGHSAFVLSKTMSTCCRVGCWSVCATYCGSAVVFATAPILRSGQHWHRVWANHLIWGENQVFSSLPGTKHQHFLVTYSDPLAGTRMESSASMLRERLDEMSLNHTKPSICFFFPWTDF